MTDQLDTISADDVVRVASAERDGRIEVSLTVDTGDAEASTTLSPRQAVDLVEKLLTHARFFVCATNCPTMQAAKAQLDAAPAEEPKEGRVQWDGGEVRCGDRMDTVRTDRRLCGSCCQVGDDGQLRGPNGCGALLESRECGCDQCRTAEE